MESLNHSAIRVEDTLPLNDDSVTPQPETLAPENLFLRSQLFRKKLKAFLPFKQETMPPRAEEWIRNLGDVPIPPTGNIERLGTLQLDWAIKSNHRGSCPLLHTIFYNGRAQSAWDPMPEEMLIEYLETISKIPYSFSDIVEEYLPGVFDPIRTRKSLDTHTSSCWYPKPIVIAACVFAERRILSDPRTEHLDEGYDAGCDEDSNQNSDDEDTNPNLVVVNLCNQNADLDQSDTESSSSYATSIRPNTGSDSVSGSDGGVRISHQPDSDSDSARPCLDGLDTCLEGECTRTDYSECSSDNIITSENPDTEGDSDDSGHWDVLSIYLEVQQAQDELKRRGLELRCYI